ncbi:hypothetical protein [Leptospira andrefontaineae]|uniref:Uncharacterized protein n=1 Tax=Leptospira andrefontaineae TaxID=2484976 RepID=A0A4R9H6R5_9LEPT|nr:hypothetical protein [Leptospira andrefontaineae]TGK41268.1 hypothetical protein EHO65_07525 [Leptospira andrefontaineae]
MKVVTIAVFTYILLIYNAFGEEKKTNPVSEFKILKLNQNEVQGIYHFSSPAQWAKILNVKEPGPWICSQIDNKKNSIRIKFVNNPEVFQLSIIQTENDFISVEYNNIIILKGVFVQEKGEDWTSIKFFDSSEQVDPRARYARRMTGSQYRNSYFVKKVQNLEDCEMEYKIGGCTQDPIENREWSNCKPPGYKNLK